MLLTYIDFNNKYPEAGVSLQDYETYYSIVYNWIKNHSCYDIESLSKNKQQEIIDMLAYQINYFIVKDIEDKGIVSQSIGSISTSFNNSKEAGATNWSDLFVDWFNQSGLGIRK